MNDCPKWLSLSGAATYLDVSPDTIGRRGIPWPKDDSAVPGKIRWKELKLGESTRTERRFYAADLEALLEDWAKKPSKPQP